MNAFDHVAPATPADALGAIAVPLRGGDAGATAAFIAGGTNLVDLMKEGVARPSRLVDINRLAPALGAIEATPAGGLALGALARNADTAVHPLVTERAPLVRAALLAAASPQLRNMASNGGNLLQRTRCVYFYDVGVPCNKREPGSGCPARSGIARQHAILGASEHCIATHPSDFCVALAALDAVVHVESAARGARQIAFADFHRLPDDRPDGDTTLANDELIVRIELPPGVDAFARHSTYLKLRERQSYAFALVSVAAALVFDNDGDGDGDAPPRRRIAQARIAVGGVAHKPWRVAEAESLLHGQPADVPAFERAADRLLQGARTYGSAPTDNAFKPPLARRAIVRALEMARDGVLTNTGLDAQRGREIGR